VRALGRVQLAQGRFREGLAAYRSLARSLPLDAPAATALLEEQAAAFRQLFLEGGADGLQPIQALGLFYDHRDQTPIGADGDLMVRQLARRLVDVDLLPQAANCYVIKSTTGLMAWRAHRSRLTSLSFT
jgi:hypothetical protein